MKKFIMFFVVVLFFVLVAQATQSINDTRIDYTYKGDIGVKDYPKPAYPYPGPAYQYPQPQPQPQKQEVVVEKSYTKLVFFLIIMIMLGFAFFADTLDKTNHYRYFNAILFTSGIFIGAMLLGGNSFGFNKDMFLSSILIALFIGAVVAFLKFYPAKKEEKEE